MDLAQKKCVPCEGGAAPLTKKQIEPYRNQITGWELVDDAALRKKFRFKNFREAMAFVNKVAALAEQESHHPDIRIAWNKVTLELSTHAIQGLSENDFIMSAKINML
ncbi:MAG: 4a-hydroxytetrahydrobiopterin dehydratase [Candidatus Aenigmarchaeota archaeon]|nr:4a-hydroxytetrahydrobiopterin dehydratase [Candidatus Aenigmarchaeota archaeon]